MARYVILAIEDNQVADALIGAIGRGGGHVLITTPTPLGDEGKQTFQIGPLKGVFVRGLYMKPTQFCACADKSGGYTRGKKYGLWVHSKCLKPTRAWALGDHWYASMGKNLLPPSELAPEWRGDGVAHHRWDPVTKQHVHVETGVPWDGSKSNAVS